MHPVFDPTAAPARGVHCHRSDGCPEGHTDRFDLVLVRPCVEGVLDSIHHRPPVLTLAPPLVGAGQPLLVEPQAGAAVAGQDQDDLDRRVVVPPGRLAGHADALAGVVAAHLAVGAVVGTSRRAPRC